MPRVSGAPEAGINWQPGSDYASYEDVLRQLGFGGDIYGLQGGGENGTGQDQSQSFTPGLLDFLAKNGLQSKTGFQADGNQAEGLFQNDQFVPGSLRNWSTNDKFMRDAALLIAGGYYGGGMLGGGEAAAGAGAAAAGNGAFLGEGIASGVPVWDAALSGAAPGFGGVGGGAALEGAATGGGGAEGAASSELGTTGLNGMRAGELAGYGTSGALPSSAAVAGGMGGAGGSLGGLSSMLSDVAPYAKLAGGLLGAGLGAAGSRDQQVSGNRDPYGPAQPFIKQQIDQAMGLSNNLQQHPFSPWQQGAMNNQAGLLNAINQMAPALFSQNSALGAQTYDRTNPRKNLNVPASPLLNWNPATLTPTFGG